MILQGDIGYEITLRDILEKDNVMINSPGGSLFEGLAMYDYIINSEMDVGCIGIAASAATLPLIASKTRWGTPNSRYLIHNPWNFEVGDAERMQKTADELKKEQERAVMLYSKHLKLTGEEIQSLMNEERILDAQEALEIGLINEIRNINNVEAKGTDIKNLFLNYKMQIKMTTNNEEIKQELSGFKLILDKLVKFLIPPKMIILQDVNGTELDFGEIEDESQIAIGVTATVNGQPAAGEYVLNTGETYVFEGGTLTEIKEVVQESEEMKQLKAENEALKAQISEMEAAKGEVMNQINELKTKFENFKNKYSDDKQEISVPTEENQEQKRVTFKLKKQ